jgi:hypothetical protein
VVLDLGLAAAQTRENDLIVLDACAVVEDVSLFLANFAGAYPVLAPLAAVADKLAPLILGAGFVVAQLAHYIGQHFSSPYGRDTPAECLISASQ